MRTLLLVVLASSLVGGWFLWYQPVTGAAPTPRLTADSGSVLELRTAPSPGAPSLAVLRVLVDRPALQQLDRRLRLRQETDGDEAYLTTDLCEVSRLLGHHEDAVAFGQRAIELQPASSRAHYMYAKALGETMRAGGLWAAVKHVGTYKSEMQTAVDLDAGNTAARAEQIAYLVFAPGIAGGDVDRAKLLARELKAEDPRRAGLMLALAQATAEELDEAIATCTATQRRFEDCQLLSVTLGGLFQEQGRFEDAAVHFTAALAGPRTDSYYQALYQHSKMRVLQEFELEQAIEALKEYLAAEPYGDMLPSLAGAAWRIGNAHEQLGRPAAARDAYRRALELDPDFDEAQESLDALGDA